VAHGALSAMNNQIDPATGTLNCKASLNPENDAILLPGQFLRLDLLMETKRDATIIPIRAIVRVMAGSDSNAAAESFVWVLRPDHTVALRPITIPPWKTVALPWRTDYKPANPSSSTRLRISPKGRMLMQRLSSRLKTWSPE
jgi:multidrug efflux pump subunit AcrA (membrane-fusion protein)